MHEHEEFQLQVAAERPVGMYHRQASLLPEVPRSVAIIGLGGVGSWAALAIALGGVKRMLLFDADEISLHNLNRLPFAAAAIGESKAVAMANWLNLLRPELQVEARGMLDNELHERSLRSCQWIVCCTDSLKSRQMAYGMAVSNGASYLEIGADGERWTLSPEPPEFTTSLEAEVGYAVTPVHVGPCMMAGAAAAYYVLHDRRPEVSHLVEWHTPVATFPYISWLKMLTNAEGEAARVILEPAATLVSEPAIMLESTAAGFNDFIDADARIDIAERAEAEEAATNE